MAGGRFLSLRVSGEGQPQDNRPGISSATDTNTCSLLKAGGATIKLPRVWTSSETLPFAKLPLDPLLFVFGPDLKIPEKSVRPHGAAHVTSHVRSCIW